VLVEKRPNDAPFLGGLPAFDAGSAAFYDISEVKRTRINRRQTRVIAVTPRDEFRYGYKLWIDEQTAMPIRSQLCEPNGRVIEQINFTLLKIPSRIPDSAFQPEVSTEGFQWLRNDPAQMASGSGTPTLWSALRLPPGFRMTARAAQTMPGSSDRVEHLVFTDGLASVSVFIEQRSRNPMGTPLTGPARVGSSSTFSTVTEGYQVTAVGEAPPQTVRFIANSVKPGRMSLQAPPR
jgi:sigma-E factor negative regulatory protein RseB